VVCRKSIVEVGANVNAKMLQEWRFSCALTSIPGAANDSSNLAHFEFFGV